MENNVSSGMRKWVYKKIELATHSTNDYSPPHCDLELTRFLLLPHLVLILNYY